MPEAKVYNKEGNEVSKLALKEELFAQKPNEAVLHQAVVAYLANQRQGTSMVKSRAEMSGGGIKPWRQKGTGRARSGSNTSPVWVGGGRAFGPEPKDWRMGLPKKMRRAALKSALSAKAAEEKFLVVQDFDLEAPKTKTIAQLFGKLGVAESKVLFLWEGKSNLEKSSRNLPNVVTKRALLVNPYDLVWADWVVATESGYRSITETFA
ncbi:MAG: 50S ribosomal protein L4 [candidate division Zixibacteria bacterium]|nr:50S ribosomal protein L4 [candidate division Zixibacteria bacterium]MCI0596950.1 50S ribosomal protein L4 [candidate division Zixibacteria bacterium]